MQLTMTGRREFLQALSAPALLANVGGNIEARNARAEVLKTFFDLGGGMVDSSPMYGSAEEVMGYALQRLESQGVKPQESLFSTTKVWTRSDGEAQIADSYRLWGLDKFDLYQIHNLLNWQDHLVRLQQLKQAGKIRYIGITTSHGRRHEDLEQIMKTQPIDSSLTICVTETLSSAYCRLHVKKELQ